MDNPTPKKRAKPKRPSLSLKELQFCTTFVEHGNATDAYRTAFPDPARSDGSTRVLAFRLLRRPPVRDYIWELRTQACDVAQATVSKIAQGLSRAAFADLRKLYDARGQIKLPHEWPDELALVVDGVDSEDLFETVTEVDPDTNKKSRRKVLVGYARKVRLAKRVDALKTLAVWRRMIGRDAEAEVFERELAAVREMLEQVKKGRT